ncbi:MAG TPA: hypothetical protein VGO59_06520 [Verrucomicrobiae bacterium]
MRASVCFLAALLAVSLGRAEADSNLISRLEPVAPFPALSAAAQADGIPLMGIDAPSDGKALSPGDTVAALVTLNEKGARRSQWLVHIEVAKSTNAPSAEDLAPCVMHTSTGHKYEFSSAPAELLVRTIGPFADPKAGRKRSAAKDKSATIDVNKDFLAIGLDSGAAAAWRWGAFDREKKQTSGTFAFSVANEPFPSAEVERVRLQDAPLQLTAREERALAGWIPALTSYFGIIEETPNLSGILYKVLDLPSVWSMARNMGVKADIGLKHGEVTPVSVPGWGLPDEGALYALPITVKLNGRPALILTLIATAPRPPLLACGGIVGMVAENPADEENYLTLRVVSARGAPAR